MVKPLPGIRLRVGYECSFHSLAPTARRMGALPQLCSIKFEKSLTARRLILPGFGGGRLKNLLTPWQTNQKTLWGGVYSLSPLWR
jgi:hypothetical protein